MSAQGTEIRHHQSQLPVVWHCSPLLKHGWGNSFYLFIFPSSWLTHFLKTSFKAHDLQVITVHQRASLAWAGEWKLLGNSFWCFQSVRMKSDLLLLTVFVSRAQQSPALGEMVGLFIPPPRGRAALRCFCRSAGCSAHTGETGLKLRAEWSNSRTDWAGQTAARSNPRV